METVAPEAAPPAPLSPPAPAAALSQSRKYAFFGAAFGVSLLADQATKIWARSSLRGQPPTVVIDGWFDFRYSENPGAAFGLFRNLAGGRWLLLPIGVLAMVVVANLVRRLKADQLRLAAELGLLAGGALGNIIDRVTRAVVTDFVLWKAPPGTWLCRGVQWVLGLFNLSGGYCEWPIFNVADAALVVGVIALLLDMKAEPEPAATPAAPTASRGKRKRS